MKKTFKKINIKTTHGLIFASIILFIGVLAIFSAIWFRIVYGKMGFDSILFTLFSNGDGVESGILLDYLLRAFLPTVLLFSLLCFLLFWKPKKELFVKLKKRTVKLYPFSYKASRILCYVLSVLLIVSGTFISQLSRKIGSAVQKTTFYETYYVSPNETEITFPEQKSNLIYIILESMETTYFSREQGGILEHEIANELWSLSKENINFSHTSDVGGYMYLNGTNWTAASMVAQSTGLPLKIGTYTNEDFSKGNFLPNATSITDILKENGYYQTLMVGSNSAYGNRSDFYKTHGIDKIYDIHTAYKDGIVPDGYFVWWGMEDKYLYQYAKQELTEISKKNQPFAFTMLTVDTHFANGYVCDLCGNEFDEQYENVISCASRQLNDFVNWIKAQPFYEDTTIIIVGDHATMDNEYMTRVGAKSTDHRMYNCIINSKTQTEFSKNRKFTVLDMFPTTLAAMGCTIEGERLGLGTNLFSGKKTLIEELTHTYVETETSKESDFYYQTFYNPK